MLIARASEEREGGMGSPYERSGGASGPVLARSLFTPFNLSIQRGVAARDTDRKLREM
jgi:hypothetical protein